MFFIILDSQINCRLYIKEKQYSLLRTPEVVVVFCYLVFENLFQSRFTFMHLADAVVQSNLQLHSGYTFLISICVPWESNPQPFALLTQCSTTEPHRNTRSNIIYSRASVTYPAQF